MHNIPPPASIIQGKLSLETVTLQFDWEYEHCKTCLTDVTGKFCDEAVQPSFLFAMSILGIPSKQTDLQAHSKVTQRGPSIGFLETNSDISVACSFVIAEFWHIL